ncbi:MAG: cob(I)yrinic acid a,c-diamide adenosyltransferase [Spirochaetia bacterium]|nr:cob(I)yrinic acid a,c-diamide adenosyltransferase [Spirochaetia bacterium]
MLQVYTGNGKGKTTAAMGLAIRAAGAGLRTAVYFFLKDGRFPVSEIKALQKAGTKCFKLNQSSPLFDKNVEMEALKKTVENDMKAIYGAIDKYDVVVMDEFIHVMNLKLADEAKTLRELKKYSRKTEIILTGRGASGALKKTADLVTEMREIKHPYKKGIKARKGIDF